MAVARIVLTSQPPRPDDVADIVAYVLKWGGLPEGATILVSVQENAVGGLLESGIAALEAFGALKLRTLGRGDNYVFVGTKGKGALSGEAIGVFFDGERGRLVPVA